VEIDVDDAPGLGAQRQRHALGEGAPRCGEVWRQQLLCLRRFTARGQGRGSDSEREKERGKHATAREERRKRDGGIDSEREGNASCQQPIAPWDSVWKPDQTMCEFGYETVVFGSEAIVFGRETVIFGGETLAFGWENTYAGGETRLLEGLVALGLQLGAPPLFGCQRLLQRRHLRGQRLLSPRVSSLSCVSVFAFGVWRLASALGACGEGYRGWDLGLRAERSGFVGVQSGSGVVGMSPRRSGLRN